MKLSQDKKIAVWGLTGGIGSGKSTAARFFQENGIAVINLDLLGKEILDEDTSVHAELRKIFGNEIFSKQGLDRKAIREIVFKDSQKREALETLLHPKIWKLFEKRVEEKQKAGTKIVLCEAALIIEHDHANLFPKLIVVMAKEEIRRRRVESRDQIASSLFNEILKTQISDEKRKTVATDIIMNEGSQEDLKQAVFQLVQKWKQAKLF
jgi:dephospho-CoA kinase